MFIPISTSILMGCVALKPWRRPAAGPGGALAAALRSKEGFTRAANSPESRLSALGALAGLFDSRLAPLGSRLTSNFESSRDANISRVHTPSNPLSTPFRTPFS